MTVPEITNEDIDRLIAEHNAALPDPARQWWFDEPRREVIVSWQDTQSCPGSGKTTLVAAKLLLLARKWQEPYRGICALTHTNVARDEILSKILAHPAGFALSGYPHFVGTIQEFVNRFLGLPYVRTDYEFKRLIEDDEGRLEVSRAQMPAYTVQQICGNLRGRCNWAADGQIIDYLGSLHFVSADGDLRFFKQHGSVENSPASSGSPRRNMLSALKEAMCQAGVFHFRDMYAFAERLIEQNPEIVSALRKRFPVVMIDEMQDTQNFQDELLRRIFDCDEVHLQCLGDPDQAIFDRIGGGEPNETYNGRNDLHRVSTTHRFGTDIAEKIVGLSYNRLEDLTSCRDPARGDYPHTIFLYDNQSTDQVLEAFAALVAEIDPDGNWRVIKAVGGLDGENGQIRRYWPQFDKSRSPRSPRPQKLIHAVRHCADLRFGHASYGYALLVQCVVDLLRKANIRTRNSRNIEVYFSPQTLARWLREYRKYEDFRRLLTTWMLEGVGTRDEWAAQIETLKTLIGIGAGNGAVTAYLQFDAAVPAGDEDQDSSLNIYRAANDREITVGTIHSVKGETHDATLMLETQYRTWFDCLEMLPFMLDPALPRPAHAANSRNKDSTLAEYMRKLYVAGTRPRHLLCMAIHRDHLNADQRGLFEAAGWSIVEV